MSNSNDLIEKKFNLLTLKKIISSRKCECTCDCGTVKIFYTQNVTKGSTKSCGCLRSIFRQNYDEQMKNKLISNIKKLFNTGCWEWQGSKHRQGYGHFPYRGKPQLAHRISWKLFNGEIPEGMKVCHRCDNPTCVNPDHLFLGSQKQNVKDMFNKNRKDHRGEKHPRVKLSKEEVDEIRDCLLKGMTQEEICKKYKITNGHVGSIKHRRTWKDI